MLCLPHYKVGLLGSCFFIGIILTIIPVPALADKHGRKNIYVASLIVSLCAQAAFMVNTRLDVAYMLMIVVGMTFPGKSIVGLNMGLEFLHLNSWQETTVSAFMFTECFATILMTLSY